LADRYKENPDGSFKPKQYGSYKLLNDKHLHYLSNYSSITAQQAMGSSTSRPQRLCFAKPTVHNSIKNNVNFERNRGTPLKKKMTKSNRSDENEYEFSLKPRAYR
jgi:hypothetical protein